MSDEETTNVPLNLLRDHLREDAPNRERALVRVLGRLCAVVLVGATAQGPFLGWRVVAPQLVLLASMTVWYLALDRFIARGRYRPVLSWINVFIEASVPIPFLVIQGAQRGSEYALTASIHMVWGALLALSCLRMRPQLCVAAGLTAAAEYVLLYVTFLSPRLGQPPLVTLTAVGISMRALYLCISGFIAAAIAHQLLKKAELALAEVRARDLMSKYFVQEQLGSGGMAEVFRATYSPEGGFEKPVAIKRVAEKLSSDPHFVEMFRDEARLCSTLSHPNIVQVLDVGKFNGRYVIAMELVDGASLQRLLMAGVQLPWPAISFLAHQLGAALQYLHNRVDSQGERRCIIHHDVNPPNILVSRVGEVKLADFGIARATQQLAEETRAVVRGKKRYLAPEQVLLQPLDGRVDLFSLGLTLHATVTGRHPFEGTADEVKERIASENVAPPSQRRPDVPAVLEEIVMRLLERDRSKRTPTGAELCAALERLPPEFAPSMAGQRALAMAVRFAVDEPAHMRLERSAPIDSTLRDANTVAVTPKEPIAGAKQLTPPPSDEQRTLVDERPVPK